MNTEKLYTIAKELNDDFASTKISENLNEVIANLQNLINSPNNPTYQTGLRTGLDSFYSSLSSSKVNSFSPAQKDVLSQIEGGVFLGNNLIEVVTDLIERNQLTPSVALEQLTKYQEAINRLRDGVNKIVSGFNDLKLEKEILDNNTCEVGVLIPRTQIDNSLSIFSKEVNELIFIFNHFSEFAEGEKKDYKIRSLSSSDLFVSIVSQPVVWVLAFAKSVD